ncbi:MAG: hypothetical protein BGO66_02945 [Alicycliphilus sp. 69-12]|nr:MAG: hypothetical protein BGO66_02945 [Alicycliphilus sp. 69-12]
MIGALIAFASLVTGAILLGSQIASFLKSGTWESSGVLYFLGELFLWEWALMPMDWVGLHSMLNSLNTGFSVAFVGSFIGLVLASFEAS